MMGFMTWVAIVLAASALLLALCAQTLRIIRLERRAAEHSAEIVRLALKLGTVVYEACAPPVAPGADRPTAPLPGNAPVTPLSPPTGMPSATSPNGQLMRGSFSPDGTKFAGYEEKRPAQRGIAVEVPAEGRVRYVMIFSPSQSTGAGTTLEPQMSVRWVDDKTIEYDVLVTEGGNQEKRTERIRIGF
jgi:hypothetical protein